MDKMFKTRYEVAKSDNVDLKREIYNPKTFYPDDPNLSDEDKRLVERTYRFDNCRDDYIIAMNSL